MLSKSLQQVAIKSRQLPLRVVLIVPFVLQVSIAVGFTGYLALRNGQKAVNDLATQLQSEVSDRVAQHLDSYLTTPNQINQINTEAIKLGWLDLDNFKSAGRYFWKQVNVFDVGYISYALSTGEYAGSGYYRNLTSATIDELSPNTQWKTYTYATDSQGNRTKVTLVLDDYKPLTEAWYLDTVQAGKPVWSKIYQWSADPDIVSITANYPLYNQANKLIGVTGVDLRLSQISDFLRQLKISSSGKTFVLERNGLLVGSSSTEQPYTIVKGKAQRLKAADSKDVLIQGTARQLTASFGNLNEIKTSQILNFTLNGQRQFAQVTPWRDKFGLDWLIVVAVPESDFMEQINANTRMTITLCLLALVVAILIGMLTAQWLAQPILRLNQAAKAIAAGDLTQMVKSDRQDELGELTKSFNRMATQLGTSFGELQSLNAALTKSENQLASYNQTLEQQVEERTRELTQAIVQLQAAQEEIIQSEKLAALGQLVAGIAHEINTPLGAIQASIGNIMGALEQSLKELPLLFQTLSPDHLTDFFTLLELAQQPKDLLSSREERQLKRTLKHTLVAYELPDGNALADTLSKMGIAVVDPILPLLQAPDAVAILDTAYQLSAIQNNSQNIRQAVEQAARIVYALKSYIHQDISSEPHVATISAGIDTVLTLYQNQIKRGIEVIKTYEAVPSILCYPEELVQVWSNLINNAIQAMNYRGQLMIAISAQNQHILVEVSDQGCGIPAAIKDRIFEPFFTTKPSGEGSGLGLSIVAKIVDKHHGTIEMESEPGHTVFRVRLPKNFSRLENTL